MQTRQVTLSGDTILGDEYLHPDDSGVQIDGDNRLLEINDKHIVVKDPLVVMENSDGNLAFDIGYISEEAFGVIRDRVKQLLAMDDNLLISSGLGDVNSWETIFTLEQTDEADKVISYWVPRIDENRISIKRIRKFQKKEAANIAEFRKTLSFAVAHILEGAPESMFAQEESKTQAKRKQKVAIKKVKKKSTAVAYLGGHIGKNYTKPESVTMETGTPEDFYHFLEEQMSQLVVNDELGDIIESATFGDDFTKNGTVWIDSIPLEKRLALIAEVEEKYKKCLLYRHSDEGTFTPREALMHSEWKNDMYSLEVLIIKTYIDARLFDKAAEFFLFIADSSGAKPRPRDQWEHKKAGNDHYMMLRHSKRIMGALARISAQSVSNIAEIKTQFVDIILKKLEETLHLMAARYSTESYKERLFWYRHLQNKRITPAHTEKLDNNDGLDMIYEFNQALFCLLAATGRQYTGRVERLLFASLIHSLPEEAGISRSGAQRDLFEGSYRANIHKQGAGLLALMRH